MKSGSPKNESEIVTETSEPKNNTQNPVSNASDGSNVNTSGNYLLTWLIIGLVINAMYLKRRS